MMEWLEPIGVICGLVVSIIALIQSAQAGKAAKEANGLSTQANDLSKEANQTASTANKLSTQANDISTKALKDSQKNYIPMVVFEGGAVSKSRSMDELCEGVFFDLKGNIYDPPAAWDVPSYLCITTRMKNIGNGILIGLKIEDFIVYSGSPTSMYKGIGDQARPYANITGKAKEEFVLAPGESCTVHFLIEGEASLEDDTNELFGEDRDFTIHIDSLEMQSINQSSYSQGTLDSYFVRSEEKGPFKLVKNIFLSADSMDREEQSK